MGQFDDLFGTTPVKTAEKKPEAATQGGLFSDLFSAPVKPATPAVPPAPAVPLAPGPRMSLLPKVKKNEQIAARDPSQQVVQSPLTPTPQKRAEGLGAVALRTGAVAMQQFADAAKFTADYLVKRPEILVQGDIVASAVKNLPPIKKAKEVIARKYMEVTDAGLNPLDIAQKKARQFNEEVNPVDLEFEKLTWKERLAPKNLPKTIYKLVPSVAGSMVGYLVNPALGAASMVGSTAEDVKEKAVKSGMDEKKAEDLGLVTGIAVGWLDRLIPGKVLSGEAKKQFMGGFLGRTLKASGGEAVTEVAQENLQLAAEATFRDDLGWNEVKTRNAMAALGGIIGGGGLGAIADAYRAVSGPAPVQQDAVAPTVPPAPPAPAKEVFVERNSEMVPVKPGVTIKSEPTPGVEYVPATPGEAGSPTGPTVRAEPTQKFVEQDGEMIPIQQNKPVVTQPAAAQVEPVQKYIEQQGEMVPIEQTKAQPQAVETAPGPTEAPIVAEAKPVVAKAAPPSKIEFQDTPVHNRVMNELVNAEAGERIMTPSDGPGTPMKFTGKKSTFPSWIPTELRRKPLLDAVSRHIMEGTVPTQAAETRLYRVVAEEMAAQDEVLNDAKFVEAQRNNLFDPFATPEENAAALAKFDQEYAKLQGKSRSSEAGRAEVQGLGKPVQAETTAQTEQRSQTEQRIEREAKEGEKLERTNERKQTAEEFVASKAAKFRTATLKDNTGAFVSNQDYYAPRKPGSPALHYEDYAALTDFIDLAEGVFRTDPRAEIRIEEDAARVMQDLFGKDVAGKSNEQLSRMARDIVDSYETKDTRNAKFRLKDDLAAKGIEVTDAQEKAIFDLNQKIFGDGDIRIMGQILANQDALGKYQRGIVEILGGQADPEGTFYHEAVHKYLDVFTDRAEHIAILKEGQKVYGIDDFAEIEERIAEDFIKYAKDRTGAKGKLRLYFDRLLQRIVGFVGNQSKIEALYADIASGKAKEKPQAPRRRARTNEKLESRVFARLQAENPDLEGEVTYQKQNLQENIEKAVQLIGDDPQQAYRIALGVEPAPEGQTSTAVNIAMAEKALDDGNNTLYAQLVKNRSLEQTRRGQELVAEKGSVTDNSTSRYVKELVKARLEKLDRTTLAKLKDVRGKRSKSRAVAAIDYQVDKAVEAISAAKELDLNEAQRLIDSLACT
jgi:hypothetical protein